MNWHLELRVLSTNGFLLQGYHILSIIRSKELKSSNNVTPHECSLDSWAMQERQSYKTGEQFTQKYPKRLQTGGEEGGPQISSEHGK